MSAGSSVESEHAFESSKDPYEKEAPELNWSGKLDSDHVNQIERASKFKKGFARKHYDYLAKNYEGIYERIGYPDPEKVAEMTLR